MGIDEGVQVGAAHPDGAADPNDRKLARPDQGMHLGPTYAQLDHDVPEPQQWHARQRSCARTQLSLQSHAGGSKRCCRLVATSSAKLAPRCVR
jgi:hypothetical protein